MVCTEKVVKFELGSKKWSLGEARRKIWIHTAENINMTRSIRKGWALIRKLGGASKQFQKKPKMSTDRIDRRVVQTSKVSSDEFTSLITRKYRVACKRIPKSCVLSRPFSVDEVNVALNTIKNGK